MDLIWDFKISLFLIITRSSNAVPKLSWNEDRPNFGKWKCWDRKNRENFQRKFNENRNFWKSKNSKISISIWFSLENFPIFFDLKIFIFQNLADLHFSITFDLQIRFPKILVRWNRMKLLVIIKNREILKSQIKSIFSFKMQKSDT